MKTQFSTAVIAIALCVLFTVQAEARTLYVNASRPNNKGNGLKLKTAKKTIQAAINIANTGDTILVYPGKYAPIRANNKKIAIKAAKGSSKTTIKPNNSASSNVHVLDLGNGSRSSVYGFRVFQTGGNCDGAVFGGRATSCRFEGMGGKYVGEIHTFMKTKLVSCLLERCGPGTRGAAFVYDSSLNRCRISFAQTWYGGNNCQSDVLNSTLSNCLLDGNGTGDASYDRIRIRVCNILNCTFAANPNLKIQESTACNSIFVPVTGAPIKFGGGNTFRNCMRGGDPQFVAAPTVEKKTETIAYDWDETGEYSYDEVRYEFTSGDCRLRQDSPCIDKGKLTKAQKKLVGSKDLAGRKRIRGKAIDRGCYEY